MLGVAGVPAAVYAVGYLPGVPRSAALGVLTGLFPLALIGVLTARDVTLFLGFWEAMTLVPAAAILVARGDPAGRRTVFEYLAITHIGGAGVWVAMILLADAGALGDPAGLAAAGAGTQTAVAIAGLIGFGTKAGIVPLHAWLPRAHPVAPTHISALMSGVMVKVALYGVVRLVFEWVGATPAWIGPALVAAGAVSAVAGILYAVLQPELKRLLAFSTIENVGVIVLALGAAAVFTERGDDTAAAVALGAALLHALNHAAFKALLFLGAGSIQRAAGTLTLDGLGGLLRAMPWTGPAVLVGALAIAGVPLLNGFASEWPAAVSLVTLGGSDDLVPGLAGAAGLAALGITVGLGALCFAKVIGLALLGRPRTPEAAMATEVAPAMAAGTGALAAACVALGILPGLLLPSLGELAPGDPRLPAGAGLTVGPTSLPLPAVALTLLALAGLLALTRRGRPVTAAPVWLCGQPPDPGLAWTSAAFTKPVLLATGGLLGAEREVEAETADGIVQTVRHRAAVPHRFDALYAPAARVALAAARVARRLQSGSLRAYLAYLVGLTVLLLLLVRTGALG